MAGIPEDGLHRVGPWPLGINNVAREDRVPTTEAGAPLSLREALNVDLDNAGVPQRRRGHERFHTATLCHSLWADDAWPFGLFVDNGDLHLLDQSGGVESLGIAVGNAPLSYAVINDRIYFSNRATSGLLDATLQAYAWAPECPAGQPAAQVKAGLGLPAGQYMVAVTFTDVLGRESGSTLAASVDVPAGSGIALTQIPQPLDALRINLYLSDANDQVLRLHSSVPPGETSLDIAVPARGRAMPDGLQFLSAMPAGQIVRLFSGRHYIADGHRLRWSPPMRYGLTDRARHVIHFNAPIDLVEPIESRGGPGLFVAAGNRTYWFDGPDPEQWSQRIRMSSGAVPGSSCRVPGTAVGYEDPEDVVVWIARNGQFCVGGAGGGISLPKQGQAVVDTAERAATLYRAEDGIEQIVAAMRGPRPQGLAVVDRAIAHVIHDDRA